MQRRVTTHLLSSLLYRTPCIISHCIHASSSGIVFSRRFSAVTIDNTAATTTKRAKEEEKTPDTFSSLGITSNPLLNKLVGLGIHAPNSVQKTVSKAILMRTWRV